MAKLIQDPCSIADFQKATFSIWFRLPAAAAALLETGGFPANSTPVDHMGGIELVVFGIPNEGDWGYSSISLVKGDFNFRRTLNLASPTQNFSIGGDTTSYAIEVHLANSTDAAYASLQYVNEYTGGGQCLDKGSSDARRFGHWAALDDFTFDAWHHLLVSIDLTPTDTFSGGFPIVSFDAHVENVTSFTRGRKISIYFDGVERSGLYITSADMTSFFDLDDPENWETDATSPSFDISLSSQELSIPTFQNRFPGGLPVTYNPKMEMQDVQAWFGTYVAPDALNLAKFFTINEGIARPANPTLAAVAFGEQDLLFRGGAERFKTNQGTGGSFTKVGTLTNYTPTALFVVP